MFKDNNMVGYGILTFLGTLLLFVFIASSAQTLSLTKEFKNQEAEIEVLNERVNQLQTDNDRLETDINFIKSLLGFEWTEVDENV